MNEFETICEELKNLIESWEPRLMDMSRDLIIKRNIMLLPGSIFNFTGNHFRIGLGKKTLKEGLNKFEEYLNDFYPNK